jgi:hypothetical protein
MTVNRVKKLRITIKLLKLLHYSDSLYTRDSSVDPGSRYASRAFTPQMALPLSE